MEFIAKQVPLLMAAAALMYTACQETDRTIDAQDTAEGDVQTDVPTGDVGLKDGNDVVSDDGSSEPETGTADAFKPDAPNDLGPADVPQTDISPDISLDIAPDIAPDAVTPPGGFCPPWPAAAGNVIMAGPSDNLVQVVSGASDGDTIMLASGTYDVSAQPIWIGVPNLTLRSVSGNRDDVILDGGYVNNGSGELIGINADGVVIADITLRRSRYHPIHVTGSAGGTMDVVIYNVHLIDPGEQAIKVNRNGNGDPADGGLVACSRIEMTPAGRAQVESQTSSGSSCYTGGIDAHAARDWVVRDNHISGFWCSGDLSEHAIHFWRGGRDTLVERNLLINNARGVGFGLTDGGARVYDDDPCGGEHDHYGGLIRNNVIIGTDNAMFASNAGMDGGISFANACDATAVHNTIASTQAPFASIEWRFPKTNATIINNIATGVFRERSDASAVLAGNQSEVGLNFFADVEGFDGALAASGAGAAAVDAGVTGYEGIASTDFYGQTRDSTPDVGAIEAL